MRRLNMNKIKEYMPLLTGFVVPVITVISGVAGKVALPGDNKPLYIIIAGIGGVAVYFITRLTSGYNRREKSYDSFLECSYFTDLEEYILSGIAEKLDIKHPIKAIIAIKYLLIEFETHLKTMKEYVFLVDKRYQDGKSLKIDEVEIYYHKAKKSVMEAARTAEYHIGDRKRTGIPNMFIKKYKDLCSEREKEILTSIRDAINDEMKAREEDRLIEVFRLFQLLNRFKFQIAVNALNSLNGHLEEELDKMN